MRRDRFYYDSSNGGLTISGGEPCAQWKFTAALLDKAEQENIHAAIETSGMTTPEILDRLARKCKLWLFDIKASPAKYLELTGADYRIVLENLKCLSMRGSRIILRVPLVMGMNCEAALLDELKKLARLPGVEKVDLLPYHNMGKGKATCCGKPEPDWDAFSTPSNELLENWRAEIAL